MGRDLEPDLLSLRDSRSVGLVSLHELRQLYTLLPAPDAARMGRALDILVNLRLNETHPAVTPQGVRDVLRRRDFSPAPSPARVEVWEHPGGREVLVPDGVRRDSALRLRDLAADLAAHTGCGMVAVMAVLIDASAPTVQGTPLSSGGEGA